MSYSRKKNLSQFWKGRVVFDRNDKEYENPGHIVSFVWIRSQFSDGILGVRVSWVDDSRSSSTLDDLVFLEETS